MTASWGKYYGNDKSSRFYETLDRFNIICDT